MTRPETSDILAFGPFRLAARERLLTRDGAPVELGARALDILIALVSRPNEVIGKRALLAQVWPDATVEEGSLRFHIAGLRKALGDGKDGARYIATLPGRGYCFVAPIARVLAPDAPQAATAVDFPHANLPARLTRMIGRADDVRAVAARLIEARCVTIVGAGGVGKTTVAIAVAHALAADFAGAVLFVDLSMLSDPNLVATAATSMLGVSVQADDPTPGLLAYLRDRRILVILDTCEHVIEAAAALTSSILAAAPQVHILATSREALRVAGEHIYRLEPLACPPDEPGLTAAAARTFPAADLFVARVAASGARLEFGDAEAAIVAEICRKLDGVPLAIELAAGRVASYGLQQTAALLDRALQWSGPRTAPARQKTLNATLDWSYGLLSEPERVVLRRLAVFVGTFTIDAARALATSADIDDAAVFGAIDSLVAKSMVATNPLGAMMRYRLLDTTRTYARALAVDDAERREVDRRHADWYRHWLEDAAQGWRHLSTGMERAPYFAGRNNVRAALAWCFGASGDAATGVALAAAAAPVFLAMALFTECQRWCAAALAAAPGAGDEMNLQVGLGLSSIVVHGASDVARAAVTRGLALAAHDARDRLQVLRSATDVAEHLAARGRRDDASALLRPALAQLDDGADGADLQAAKRLLASLEARS